MHVFASRRLRASAIAATRRGGAGEADEVDTRVSTSGIPPPARGRGGRSAPRAAARPRDKSAEPHADAGACSDGFRTEAFPQKIDGNAFQATFGSGVLNEISSAATPTGRRRVSTVRWGIEAVVVRPYERRPSPATNSPISTAASVSPRASSSDFPVSAATSSLASSLRSRRSSAIARTTFPRSTGVTAAHAG